jgi:hypothetical protein
MLEMINQAMLILSPIALVATLCFSGLGVYLTGKALLDAKHLECPALRTGYRTLACLVGVIGVNMLLSACDSLARYLSYLILTM